MARTRVGPDAIDRRVARGFATARRIVAGAEQGVDIVLSDVVLPGGVSGTDLAAEIVRERAEIGVVLMSGYRSRRDPEDSTLPPRAEFLDKPFCLVDLADALRRTGGRNGNGERQGERNGAAGG
jgi:DNA-binding NtrC family response regulator